MSLNRLLSHWRSEPSISANISAWETRPARPPDLVPFPPDMAPEIVSALQIAGIQHLFGHQVQVWDACRQDQNVVIATGTASGKTLAYNLPILQRYITDPSSTSLYLFPTKALAHDQLSGLRDFLHSLPVPPYANDSLVAATYDGDTPPGYRRQIRSQARFLLTNPDMLHTGILPHHPNWADFFRRLRFIVIDEIHIYRGVFGSHVANVLRRLDRITTHYNARPTYLMTSATIANPQELGSTLIERSVASIDQDGSGSGPRHFLIYNPPLIDPDLGLRRSAIHETVRLAEDLLAYRLQTIIFGRSRRTVEIILTYLRERAADNLAATDEIRGYRSGYLPGERRLIESGLRSGDIRAVAATNALELGIDIGGLSAALMVGYPGSIAAVRQQSGRAGRAYEPAVSVLVATPDPLDQFLVRHPDYLVKRSPEAALINPDNLLILLAHLQCAAFELPFHSDSGFGTVSKDILRELLDYLTTGELLYRRSDSFFWMADYYPAQQVSLRTASTETILLQTCPPETRTVGAVDRASALWMTHPGAIYLHEGVTYLVRELDLEKGLASLHAATTDYYTQTSRDTQVALISTQESTQINGGVRAFGEIQVKTQIVGYKKIRWHTHENLGYHELDLPPTELFTSAYWLAIEDQTLDELRSAGLWRDDPIDYGPNWYSQRIQALERDGYRCQACRKTGSPTQLHIHHKTPFRLFQQQHGDRAYWYANRLENLVTLCPPCHRRVEIAVKIRGGLSGLVYVFSQLAPLFLMCAESDLGVHYDPESPLADGKPTIILYEQIPAGIGFSQRLYELHSALVEAASELVANCACTNGCPSCVGPGGEIGLGSKPETLALLEYL